MPINLISDKQKSDMRLETISRKVSLALVYLGFSLLFFIGILFFLKLYVSSQVVKLSDRILAQNEKLDSPMSQEIKAKITQTNKDLQSLQKVDQSAVLFSPFLERLSFLTPNPVYFIDIDLRKNAREIENENKEKVTQFFAEFLAQGVAQTREDLYDFRKIILEANWLEGPYFAPISWKNPVDSQFSFEALFVPPNQVKK